MDSAPLPPHERTWRHPSELGLGAPVDPVDDDTSGLGGVLLTGTLAVMVVAALAVTLTPRRSTSPVALTATTLPAVAQTVRSSISTITTRDVQADAVALAHSVRNTRLDEFVAIPSAIASHPTVSSDDLERVVEAGRSAMRGAVLPDLHDRVTVIVGQMSYTVRWRDVPQLAAVDSGVVVDANGAVVALLTDGRLVVADDTKVDAVSADE